MKGSVLEFWCSELEELGVAKATRKMGGVRALRAEGGERGRAEAYDVGFGLMRENHGKRHWGEGRLNKRRPQYPE